jgi:hypothetical protein
MRWKILKTLWKHKAILIPLGVGLALGLRRLEDFLNVWDQLNKTKTPPSGRKQKVGESDGEFTQVESETGSPKDRQPQGVTAETKTELVASGTVKPVQSTENNADMKETDDVGEATDKYLGR